MEDFKEIKTINKPVRDPLPRKKNFAVKAVPDDLMGDKEREHIQKVSDGIGERFRALLKRLRESKPENS
jgi:hypothetical protein